MYDVSDRSVAQFHQLPPLQFGHRSSGKPPQRPGTELALIVNLHPNTLLSPLELRVLEDNHGLDGHWLCVAVAHYLPGLDLDPSLPYDTFSSQLTHALNVLSDLLFNDIVAGYEAEGLDDETLCQKDSLVIEDMPTLIAATETIIKEMCYVIGGYESPSYCSKRSMLPYLLGYSINSPHSGCLHFHFSDHENHHTVRL